MVMAEQSFQDAMLAMQLKSINEKKTKYRMLNKQALRGQTVFTGSSLMEFFPIDELQHAMHFDRVIYNRGLAGATTADFVNAMEECIFELEPSKLFINIGSNDIGSVGPGGYQADKLMVNYNTILQRIKTRLPDCSVFVMAYYPVNPKADFGLPKPQKEAMFLTRTNENIATANKLVEALAQKRGFSFIDVNEGLSDGEGNLKAEFSVDGVHLWPNAYAVILDNMRRYL
jgi:lysophospholipase L1-like esterase